VKLIQSTEAVNIYNNWLNLRGQILKNQKMEKNVNMVAERFIFVKINHEIYNKIKSENADMSNEK